MLYGEDEDPCLCDPCVCDANCSSTDLERQNDSRKSSRKSCRKSLEYDEGLAEDEEEGEVELEGEDGICTCDPCECETPPGSREKSLTENVSEVIDIGSSFQLDEFSRAKAYFMNTSTKSGINLYDHLTEVIRKLLDDRAPNNPVDYFEEVSMNVKRYRYQQTKDVLRDVFYISPPVLSDARNLTDNWKKYSQWSEEAKESPGEGYIAESFQNLLRLQYYLEQVNIGLPREEMFRLALAIKDLTATRPFITNARFWGKIFGTRKNYYVVEAEIQAAGNGDSDLWQQVEEPSEEVVSDEGDVKAVVEVKVPGPQATFERAGNVVLDSDFLTAYSKTSGLSADQQAMLLPKPKSVVADGIPTSVTYEEWGGEDFSPHLVEDPEAVADYAKWQSYQEELMTRFPTAPEEVVVAIPPEAEGTGANRRAFYICNEPGLPWILLPPVNPQQINGSRQIRWSLTGELDSTIRSYPIYPGKEGHFLKALLIRASAGSLASPKGFYKTGFEPEFQGDDDESVDEEEEHFNPPGDDKVSSVRKYAAPMSSLTNPTLNFWVHHACPILPQGRKVWWNPVRAKFEKHDQSEDESEDEDEEYEGEDQELPGREVGPPLFTPISQDKAADGRAPWTLQTSSSVFKEFQVVSVRSNTWPGSSVVCTVKGKVSNIYVGDGLKFADRTYAPPVPEPPMNEYRPGPEIQEFDDPTAEEEQKWLDKLEAVRLAALEPPSMSEEETEGEGEYSDED